MRRRAESVPEIANQCSDFEEDNSKSRIRIFGWSVSDAIAEILERIRVGKYSLHEDDGSSGAEEQVKNQPSESKRRDELDLETRELHMQLTDIQQPIRTAESVRET